MRELWPWVCALDAFDYGDKNELGKLISTSTTVPPEFMTIVGDIVKGKRTPNYKAAPKLKIPATERMKVAGSLSLNLGLMDNFRYDAIDGESNLMGASLVADQKGKEPQEIISDLSEERRNLMEESAKELGVSIPTLKNILLDLEVKIKNWPDI